ncbi:MAG TPA: hypothetical protein VMQ52_01810 [Candidatus Saccharimonadales bacterium]|jgi:hypothetical protein|nr:hypothetical protein [Candidatus Saccharimonadales bacterium]
MKDHCCIAFAGVVGSSKTPIANYLSTSLGLPVFNNDDIRKEVTEDMGHFDVEEYNSRQEQRCKAVLASGQSFIYDGSVDRKWPKFKGWLDQENYRCFIISLNLSHKFLIELYEAKKYTEGHRLPELIEQHNDFVRQYGDAIGLHIDDTHFANRLNIAKEHVSHWLES